MPELREFSVGILLSLVLAACNSDAQPSTDVGYDPSPESRCAYRWNIPPDHRFGLSGSLDQMLRRSPESFNVYWPSDHLVENIAGYVAEVEGASGRFLSAVYVIPRSELYRREANWPESTYYQIFTRTGEIYQDWSVEPNPTPPGFFRIWNPDYVKKDTRPPRGDWWVSRVDPRKYDKYLPMEQWFVATCSWRGGRRPETQVYEVCYFNPRIAKDIAVTFFLRGPNIALHEQVTEHIGRMLRSWVEIPRDDPACFDDPFEGYQ